MPRSLDPKFPEAVVLLRRYASPDLKLTELRDKVNSEGFSLTYEQVKGAAYRYSLPYKPNMRHNLLMTDKQAEYLASIIPGKSSEEITRIFNEHTGLNLTTRQIRGWKKNHKTPSGYDTRWHKNHHPSNAGKRFPGRINAGCWTKGHSPCNEKPAGYISDRGEYMYIKTKEGHTKDCWMLLHRYVWEQAHGPVPKGMVITFKDGDSHNCSLDNLVLVTRPEHGVINMKYGGTVKGQTELNTAIRTAAKLSLKIQEKKK